MKRFFTLTIVFALFLSLQVNAQLRDELNKNYEFSGPIVNTKAPTIQTGLNDFFKNNVTMSHSYSMSFGSVGGSYQNINAYTNTINIAFSQDLTGRLDVAFLHSPFGGSNFVQTDNNIGGEILIRNAELNYQVSENAHIRLQYQQLPSGYGYGYHNPFGYGFNSRYNRFNSW